MADHVLGERYFALCGSAYIRNSTLERARPNTSLEAHASKFAGVADQQSHAVALQSVDGGHIRAGRNRPALTQLLADAGLVITAQAEQTSTAKTWQQLT